MPNSQHIASLQRRVDSCEQSVAAFMRIQEELRSLRKGMPANIPTDRIDAMIKLNQETLKAIKRGLEIAEENLATALSRTRDSR